MEKKVFDSCTKHFGSRKPLSNIFLHKLGVSKNMYLRSWLKLEKCFKESAYPLAKPVLMLYIIRGPDILILKGS